MISDHKVPTNCFDSDTSYEYEWSKKSETCVYYILFMHMIVQLEICWLNQYTHTNTHTQNISKHALNHSD